MIPNSKASENPRRPVETFLIASVIKRRTALRKAPVLFRANNLDRVARAMVARYGADAAQVAATRLNAMIDCGDRFGRDLWACIVSAIHERQDEEESHLAGCAVRRVGRAVTRWFADKRREHRRPLLLPMTPSAATG